VVLRPGHVTRRATPAEKKKLQNQICTKFNVPNASLFPYARSAFFFILKALDLPKGSEILLTPITIGPMLEVIRALGHRPVFVDLELKTFCADVKDLEKKLQTKPACFLCTYLFGYVPDIEKIAALCRASGTLMIEDFSHNIGAKFNGRFLGSFGRAGIYSASLLKYVDGYNGAFVITEDSGLFQRIEAETAQFTHPNSGRIAGIIKTTLLWNFCLNRAPFALLVFPLLRLIKKWRPSLFEKILGPKILMKIKKNLPGYFFEDVCQLQCEMIGRHLEKLEELLAERSRLAERVARLTGKDQSEPARKPSGNTYWQLLFPVQDLQKARQALFKIGVETGATNLFNLAETEGVHLENAKKVKENHIFIPLHPWVSSKHYEKIFLTLAKIRRPLEKNEI
jgi:dTDP-4-amino-4,6-dideoxygalactose transaminase